MTTQFNYCAAGSHAAEMMLTFFGKKAVNKKENVAERQLCIMKIVEAMKEFDNFTKGKVNLPEKRKEVRETIDELPF